MTTTATTGQATTAGHAPRYVHVEPQHDASGPAHHAQGSGRETKPPLGDLFSRLVDDGRNLAKAEVALLKVQATERAKAAGLGIGLLFGAYILAQAAVVALLVGLIIWITDAIGAGWATLIVVGGTLAVAGLLAWIGIGKLTTVPAKDDTP